MPEHPLVFLKLGGSLITNKFKAETVYTDVIQSCLTQIRRWKLGNPESSLILGHGSGSFGHNAAKSYRTREGVSTKQDWYRYTAVWQSARRLNNIIIEACNLSDIPVVDFPISAAAITNHRAIETWDIEALKKTLKQGVVPVVHGDVCIDRTLGGTILSTEEIFAYLAGQLKPSRILLASIEQGVFADYPANQQLLTHIPVESDPSTYLQGSNAQDVTGGMAAKVALSQAIAKANPSLEIRIFSGLENDAIYRALSGESLGTCIF